MPWTKWRSSSPAPWALYADACAGGNQTPAQLEWMIWLRAGGVVTTWPKRRERSAKGPMEEVTGAIESQLKAESAARRSDAI